MSTCGHGSTPKKWHQDRCEHARRGQCDYMTDAEFYAEQQRREAEKRREESAFFKRASP